MRKYGFSFSWKRALGISSLRQKFARKTGIPTTKGGLERKIGGFFVKLVMQFFKNLSKDGTRKEVKNETKNEIKNEYKNDL